MADVGGEIADLAQRGVPGVWPCAAPARPQGRHDDKRSPRERGPPFQKGVECKSTSPDRSLVSSEDLWEETELQLKGLSMDPHVSLSFPFLLVFPRPLTPRALRSQDRQTDGWGRQTPALGVRRHGASTLEAACQRVCMCQPCAQVCMSVCTSVSAMCVSVPERASHPA